MLAVLMLLSWGPASAEGAESPAEIPMGAEDTWTIFLYACGTDLESKWGMTSFNIEQVLETDFPDNVKVIMQTGGTKVWGDPTEPEEAAPLSDERPTAVIDPSVLQRYEITDELTLVDEQPLASMGSGRTLYDFLSWGVENYPAEKMGVILWDHGGAIMGVCMDELFSDEAMGNDILRLYEIDDALARVSQEMTDRFEFVGFDACLMGSVETASLLMPYARYMYASEETEPGFGWDYTTLLSELAEDASIDGAALGIALCDGYFAFNRAIGLEEDCTLSVIDLDKMDGMLSALDDFSEVLLTSFHEPSYFAGLTRGVSRAEHYLYPWMVDLGDMAEKLHHLAPAEAEAVLSALEEAVVHSVSGPARAYANGLAIFYPIKVNLESMQLYDLSFPGSAYTDLIMEIDRDLRKHIYSSEKALVIAQEPELDAEGIYTMQIDPLTLDHVREIGFFLYEEDAEDGIAILLGVDDHVRIDWDTGVVTDDFDAQWPYIGGQPLCIILEGSSDDYAVFRSPILLNGNSTNLMIKRLYDAAGEGFAYEITGTWDGIDPYTGMASRMSRPLQAGDSITPMYPAFVLADVMDEEDVDVDEEDILWLEGEPILVRRSTAIEQAPLDAGNFLYQYMVTSVYGSEYTYVPIQFEVDEARQGAEKQP